LVLEYLLLFETALPLDFVVRREPPMQPFVQGIGERDERVTTLLLSNPVDEQHA
jgi:hypothetical protein